MYYRHYEQWGEEVVNEVEEEGLRWSLFTLNADGSWDFWQKTDGCFQKRIRWEMDTEIKIKFSQYILNSYKSHSVLADHGRGCIDLRSVLYKNIWKF